MNKILLLGLALGAQLLSVSVGAQQQDQDSNTPEAPEQEVAWTVVKQTPHNTLVYNSKAVEQENEQVRFVRLFDIYSTPKSIAGSKQPVEYSAINIQLNCSNNTWKTESTEFYYFDQHLETIGTEHRSTVPTFQPVSGAGSLLVHSICHQMKMSDTTVDGNTMNELVHSVRNTQPPKK